MILQAVPTESLAIIKKWYVPDLNAVPTEYILQPIDRDMEEYDEPPEEEREDDPFDYVKAYLNKEKDAEEKKQKRISAARKRWAVAEKELAAVIRKGVDVCVETGTMNHAVAEKYFWSGRRTLAS